ncbi:Tyrosine-protein phosphatase MSG5 [Diplodia seriata]|uniref:protein-tyrosine-phosphatase n=2 Tax=Diplodia seriata TaxID=420778 RepID=A0A1S8BI09_9PEZI|nr:Tyrosine-protein phosphatase MSG5 [Diplodia seriata]
MDGSSLTEPSPGPSPASPAAKASASSFSPDFRSRNASTDKSKGEFFELQRPTTPAKKPRNLKNLAVNTSSTLSLGRAANTAALPVQNPPASSSAPPSPSFVKPPTPPRRKPSNLALTLQTNAKGPLPTLSIPPTPSIKRPNTLRHFQSSPSLPLCSPAVPPAGGMELPPPARSKPQPHGFAEIPVEEDEEEQEPNFDVPQSREEKPEAYPNGPICIYESGVDLYYEPTAEIAARYDVVLNVASEVVNPFKKAAQETKRDAKAVSKETPTSPSTSELTQPSDRTSADGQAATENSAQAQGSSPTTPKATSSFGDEVEKPPAPSTSRSKPEYIHIPWEHNTDIVPDLYTLVRVIDDRVQQGKRVLVHCQCGVSRSASLIVAYGLYKNPGISVQEAYDAVKKRSKWIGPNMNLIMQLQEFRNGLLRANGHSQGYKAGIPRRLSPNPMGPRGKDQSGFDANSSGSRTPATAPLPPDYGPDPVPQRASTGNMVPVSPGPTSAPSGLNWGTPGFRRTWDAAHVPLGSPVEQPFVDPMGHVIPVVTIQHPARSTPEPEREERFIKEKGRSDSDATLRQVPNFSRQLPIRQQQDDDHDDTNTTIIQTTNVMESNAAAGHQQQALDRLTSIAPAINAAAPPLSPSPFKSSLQERRQNKIKSLAEPSAASKNLEPRANSSLLKPLQMDDTLPLASPLKANFSFDNPPRQVRPNDSVISMYDRHNESRSLPQGEKTNGPTEPSGSPISEEFHMAPVVTKDESDEDFGLLSPTRFEFPKNPFDGLEPETQNQATSSKPGVSPGLPPRMHAILPPVTEVDTPEQSPFQGFGFLGSQPSPRPATPPQVSKTTQPPSEEPSPMAGIRRARTDGPEPTMWNPHENDSHLSTSEPRLRPKYSNPDLQSQRRLRALQTEMESRLPNHDSSHTSNEAATLLSPRAHEFTQNPFHFTLEEAFGSPPPVQNNRVPDPTQEDVSQNWEVPRCSTPHTMDIDPRSPPQSGVSPITRNIWDVL